MATRSRASTPEAPEPQPIRRLHESLINRIAAGEIIHRPASALKELLENALDAGATTVKITVKDGGLKLLQIQDNGCGIRKADLPLLATRFATSKISAFSDLSSLKTYGFRGEALASVSHVAHLSVVTKTATDACAWKAHYSDGALAPAKPGMTPEPKPCAGNDGTTITVEDMFYSTPTRLAALRSASEEYSRIADVVTRYAVHNPLVSFVCKKVGSSGPDITTPLGSTVPQTIGLLYGHSIGRELLKVDIKPAGSPERPLKRKRGEQESDDSPDSPMAIDDQEEDADKQQDEWSAEAYVTSPNYQARKFVFLLFVNHRLVESPRMKRAVESAYSGTLPKGALPFVYLSLNLPPHTVDVNVHPTKREVHFLGEDAITERIADGIQAALISGQGASSRTYQQTKLTGSTSDGASTSGKTKAKTMEVNDVEEEEEGPAAIESAQKKLYSHQKVRTSTHDRTLDSMFPVANRPARTQNRTQSQGDAVDAESGTQSPFVADQGDAETPEPIKLRDIPESECYLTTVRDLREEVRKNKHNRLHDIISNCVYVGAVDLERSLSLIQHSTELYLINHSAIAIELFYQLGLRQFGDFGRLKLNPAPSLRALVELAVSAEPGISQSKMTPSEIVDKITSTLLDRRALLSEYFSLDLSSSGRVLALPLLLRGYTPNLDRLPLFLMRLGPQVDWSSEAGCFTSILRELACFHLPGPLPGTAAGAYGGNADAGRATNRDAPDAEKFQLTHVVIPAARKYLVAPTTLLDKDVVKLASTQELYRVFERC